ncbi:MAG: sortase B protein-sorting domain-containing protein [Lachnospiraceae bacterium]|nr:sortase B protein-sorting domain-containing protein [Lachnospiraceae bacterium]
MTGNVTYTATYSKTEIVDPEKSDETEGTNTESPTDSETTSTENNSPAITSAETGDNSQMVLWLVLLLVSGIGLFGTAAYNTKRRRSK